jgi:hypothetical protein
LDDLNVLAGNAAGADVYALESLDQLRAIADPLRVRILEAVETRAMTAKQLADHLDEAAPKVHYHVRE